MREDPQRKLYLDRQHRKIAGVCAGLARWLDWDVTVVRVLAVLSLFFGLLGGLAYLLFWLFLTPRPE